MRERDIPTYPLRDYAFSGDGERGMIIGPDGTIVWMCAPRWDSDAVFSRLLGGPGGFYVAPVSQPRISGGDYEPRTLIWRNFWTTTEGRLHCRDALAYPGEDHRATILRRIDAPGAAHTVEVGLAPRAGYGERGARDVEQRDGIWSWRTGDLYIRAFGLPDAQMGDDGQLSARLDVPAGGRLDLVVEISTKREVDDLDPESLWTATERAWHEAVPDVTGTAADTDVAGFYAVANGLTSKHGGMVAAATTGLPERLTESRNYDYRYAWIRDQCFAGLADAAYGRHRLLDAAVGFVAARLNEDGAELKPAYTVTGEPVPDEWPLPLHGYPGATPIGGNHVNDQFQLDVFGECLELFAAAARMDRLDDEGWSAVRAAVDAIAQRWDEPDAGIWELADRWWTHSRLASIAGLHLIAPYAPEPLARQCRDLADAIEARVRDTCVAHEGHWIRAADDPSLDAALLLPALRGGIDPQAAVNVRTIDAVLQDLVRDEHLYRFRHGNRDLADAEGAFLLCEAAMALSLAKLGRREEAWRWFERVRGCVSQAGLFSEEWHPSQRQLRGNLPQGFVHALVAEAAVELAR